MCDCLQFDREGKPIRNNPLLYKFSVIYLYAIKHMLEKLKVMQSHKPHQRRQRETTLLTISGKNKCMVTNFNAAIGSMIADVR